MGYRRILKQYHRELRITAIAFAGAFLLFGYNNCGSPTPVGFEKVSSEIPDGSGGDQAIVDNGSNGSNGNPDNNNNGSHDPGSGDTGTGTGDGGSGSGSGNDTTPSPSVTPDPTPTTAPTPSPSPAEGPGGSPSPSPSPIPTEAPSTSPSPTPTEAPSPSPTPTPTPAPEEVVQDACANVSAQETKIVSVAFPNPGVACEWQQNGNLGMRNSYFQARREQVVGFDLPTNAKICDLQFNFQSQRMYYDDHFMMTFDRVLMASSYPFTPFFSVSQNLLPLYDWQRIVGVDWDESLQGAYCLGKDSNLSQCSWPATQVNGNIQMSFHSTLIQKIMSLDLNRTHHEFMFITTGDNDSSDCQHLPIEFTLTVKYAK